MIFFSFFLCSRSAFIKAYPSIEKRFQIPLARLIFLESWCTCSLKYILHLLHIILKFAFHLWQVRHSSVGRALYRKCGPSQDGNPVTGNLLFLFFFFPIRMWSFFHFIPSL